MRKETRMRMRMRVKKKISFGINMMIYLYLLSLPLLLFANKLKSTSGRSCFVAFAPQLSSAAPADIEAFRNRTFSIGRPLKFHFTIPILNGPSASLNLIVEKYIVADECTGTCVHAQQARCLFHDFRRTALSSFGQDAVWARMDVDTVEGKTRTSLVFLRTSLMNIGARFLGRGLGPVGARCC